MNDRLPSLPFNVNRPSHYRDTAISRFDHQNPCLRPWVWAKVKVTLKIQGQGHGQGQTHWSHYEALNSIDMFAIHFMAVRPFLTDNVNSIFDLENSRVKDMTKVKPHGTNWGLDFNRYVCVLFRDNRTIFGWDIANFIFDFENSRLR